MGTPLAISSDSRFLAYAAWNSLRVIDLMTGEDHFKENEAFRSVAFSPSSQLLAVGKGRTDSPIAHASITLWNVITGKQVGHLTGHKTIVSDLLFHPDGRTLISAGFDRTIRVWDISDPAQGRLRSVFHGAESAIMRIALLKDRKTLISGQDNGSMLFWDIETASQYGPIVLRDVSAFSFSQEGNSLLTADSNGLMLERMRPDYRESRTICDLVTPIRTVGGIFSTRGHLLATYGVQRVTVWDLASGTPIQKLQYDGKPHLNQVNFAHPGQKPQLHPVGFIAGDTQLVTTFLHGNHHLIWDLSTGELVDTWPGAAQLMYGFPAFTSDQRRCLTIHNTTGDAALMDFCSKEMRLGRLPKAARFLRSAGITGSAFSPDDEFFAAASSHGHVSVWKPESFDKVVTFDEVVTFDGFVGPLASVTFSPNGKRLAVAGVETREGIKIFDLESQQEMLTLPGEGQDPRIMAFSPDGNTIATLHWGNPGHLLLWTAPSFEEIEAAEDSLQ